MSYIDETYGKQLEEALRGLVSRPALGQPWFGFHESEVPAGVLLFTATTHSRVLYADFWKYIQDKNLVKTEEEWQSIYSEQGWCPFYSDGDGIDTFRMPSAPLYLHGADTLSEAGQYIKAGLPNITGYFTGRPHTSGNTRYGGGLQGEVTGAFSWHVQGGIDTATGTAETSGTSYKIDKVSFDASRSNSIYGNSSTVTPETSKMLFGIWAISAPQQPIPDATVEGIISELSVASNNALEAKNGLNGVVRSVNGVSADTVGNVSDVAAVRFEDHQYAIRLTNGLQFVWGSVNIPANSIGAQVTLFFAYKDKDGHVVNATPNDTSAGHSVGVRHISSSTIEVFMKTSAGGYYDYARTVWYFIIGSWK